MDQLYYRQIGEGTPCIILHGLYGMSDNWITFARLMQPGYRFIIPDLPNHGESFHTADFNHDTVSESILTLTRSLALDKPVLIGHSLGGRIAMRMAEQHAGLFSALVVLDISPRSYTIDDLHARNLLNHKLICETMLGINLTAHTHRNEIAEELSQQLGDRQLAGFLVKNLKRNAGGRFFWRCGVANILSNYTQLLTAVHHNDNYRCTLPSLFVKASRSDYIVEKDMEAIACYYPQSQLVEMPGARHWLHADAPEPLKDAVLSFLSEVIKKR